VCVCGVCTFSGLVRVLSVCVCVVCVRDFVCAEVCTRVLFAKKSLNTNSQFWSECCVCVCVRCVYVSLFDQQSLTHELSVLVSVLSERSRGMLSILIQGADMHRRP